MTAAGPRDQSARSPAADGGQIILLVGLFSIGLLLVAGLFIDVSLLFISRRHAQNLADAAALSGAGAQVLEAPLRNANDIEFTPEAVTDRACAVLLTRPEFSDCPVAGRTDVTVVLGVSVTVEVRVDAPVTIMAAFGMGPNTVPAKSTAALIIDSKSELPVRH